MEPNPLQSSQQDWREHVNGLLAFAMTATQTALSRDRTPERGQKTIGKIFRVTDSEIEKALIPLRQLPDEQREKMMPRCSEGCSYCCYQWVSLSALEVFAIAHYVREHLSGSEVDALVAELRAYKDEFLRQEAGKIFSLKCPLLVNDLCSVYESRPLICRGVASLDVEQCRLGKEDPNSGVQVPYIGPMVQISAALRQGVCTGMNSMGLGQEQVVLGLALLIALDDETAEQRFLNGERVFVDALPPGEQRVIAV